MVARILRFAALAAALLTGSAVRADDAPVLHVPGFPPVPLPPGTRLFGPGAASGASDDQGRGPDRPSADIYHEFGTVTPGGGRRPGGPYPGSTVVGPGGVVGPPTIEGRQAQPKAAAKPRLTPEEKQARIRRAMVPQRPLATVRRRTLDELYGKLAAAKDENEAKGVASLIAAVWMRSGSDTANLLMARAQGAIAQHRLPLAMSVLDRLVALQPDWAEAWNKRASARFLAGDFDGSMADVDRVLKLEPNHFGALNGLAMILQHTGFSKRALQVYRRELEIYPHQPAIEQMVDKLGKEVEGQGI